VTVAAARESSSAPFQKGCPAARCGNGATVYEPCRFGEVWIRYPHAISGRRQAHKAGLLYITVSCRIRRYFRSSAASSQLPAFSSAPRLGPGFRGSRMADPGALRSSGKLEAGSWKLA